METDLDRQWFDDSVALSLALAGLGLLTEDVTEDHLVTEDDLLGDGDAEFDGIPVAEWSVAELTAPASWPPSSADPWSATHDPWSATQWSVEQTLAQVASCPPGAEAIGWLTALDGRTMSGGEALAVAGAWERQARWVTARQQASWVGFVGPVAPGPLGQEPAVTGQARPHRENLQRLAGQRRRQR
jgi:hypothetical protein